MFRDDTRGQSVQVGVIILFSFAVIAFASYQAVIVPQQNQEVEFQHSQEIEDDFVNLHSSLMNAANNGEIPFTDVQLGTSYPSRLFGLNPPPVSGVVSTTDHVNMTSEGIDLASICPEGHVQTRALEYTANYNYLNNPPTLRVENGYAYRDYGDDTFRPANEEGDVEQQLVSDEQINLVAIQLPEPDDSFRREGVGATSIEMVPGQQDQTKLEEETNVTVPTQLSQEWWHDTISDEYLGDDNIEVEENELTLTVPEGFIVSCTPVGIGGAPPGGERSDSTSTPSDPNSDPSIDIDETGIASQSEAISVDTSGNEDTIIIDYQQLSSSTISLFADISDGEGDEFTEFRTVGDSILSNLGPATTNDGVARLDDVQVNQLNGVAQLYATLPGDSDSIRVEVINAGSTTPQTVYVSEFRDKDSGDESIPTNGGPYGDISSFDRMQEANDGNNRFSTLSSSYPNNQLKQTINVGTRISEIPSRSTYNIQYAYYFGNGNAGRVDMLVLDDNGDILQSQRLDQSETSSTNPDAASVELNNDARQYVQSNGVAYISFKTPDSEKSYINIYVDYVRVEAV